MYFLAVPTLILHPATEESYVSIVSYYPRKLCAQGAWLTLSALLRGFPHHPTLRTPLTRYATYATLHIYRERDVCVCVCVRITALFFRPLTRCASPTIVQQLSHWTNRQWGEESPTQWK